MTRGRKRKIKSIGRGGLVQSELALEIAPGRFVVDSFMSSKALESWVFCKVQYDPDKKTFRPIGCSLGGYHMRIPDIIRELELEPGEDTLYRLYKARFIKGRMITPHMIEIDIQSLAEHMARTRDPAFWTEERRRKYREALY